MFLGNGSGKSTIWLDLLAGEFRDVGRAKHVATCYIDVLDNFISALSFAQGLTMNFVHISVGSSLTG